MSATIERQPAEPNFCLKCGRYLNSGDCIGISRTRHVVECPECGRYLVQTGSLE